MGSLLESRSFPPSLARCRLRHGDLRVIYLYDRTADTIVIAHIGSRGDVYK